MNIYNIIVERIVSEQEKIIGPIAIEQARKISGFTVNWDKHEIKIDGNEKMKIEELVDKYKELFGKIAVDVCKEAIKNIAVAKNELPTILQ